ncbi:hypothetical protein CASFOL_027599 [Castilleja foliolosa]|uniref:DYW domain-containing protein n=1 Tax=Castilleja foliolosa TaxID=1961234 RepID=A0ABD3CF92_9LAMI
MFRNWKWRQKKHGVSSMFSPENIVSSTRRRQSFSADPTFSSLADASASRSNSFPAFAFSHNQTQIHHQKTEIPHERPGFDISQKYDLLIEKYRSCCSSYESKRFHSEIIKNGFVEDLFMGNTLINAYAKNNDILAAHNVFDEMPDRNFVTWACLIAGYAHNEMPRDAFAAFRRMLSDGFIPNHYAIGSALRACQRLGPDNDGLKHGTQIHGLVSKTHYAFDVVVSNVLISMYGSCVVGPAGRDHARRVFDGISNKNTVSYNSIISVYSQRGDVDSVFRLFSNMQNESLVFSFKPSEYTYGSLITTASELSNAYNGSLLLKQLLAKIEMSGFVTDLYVGSALVSSFAKFGDIDAAKVIFQKMGARNAVSLNGLMVGLVKLKRGDEAVEVFLETRNFVRLNSDSYVLLLSAFGEFSCLEKGKRKGKEVHGYLIRTGMSDSSISIGNGLINMYSKCRSIENARSIFNLMIDKDSVTWSSMISGLDQNEFFEDALMNFLEMKRIGQMPSNFTLISALSSCSSLCWIKMGEQTHCHSVKSGLDWDVSVSNTLLSLYADTGRIAECRKLFGLMHDHDRISWNSILRAFNSESETSIIEAAEYFIEMMRAGLSPNSVTFINILSVAASLSSIGLTRQIHGLALKYHGTMDDNGVKNSVLTSYGKCGEINDCEAIFSRMGEKDEVSWNSMISGYIKSERLVEAMDLVWQMLQNGQRLDNFTFATVLSACASVATLEHGMEVHACAAKARLISDVVIGSALVDMYGKCGRIDYASTFFELMPVKNVYSWNSMISGYARHGDGHRALKIFERMKLESQKPDYVTFVGVLSACSHVGLVNQGYEHFESMSKVYKLAPKIEHYSCMVDLLGRAGEWCKLEEFINSMKIEPNVLIWRTVLSACGRSNGRVLELGKRAGKMVMELEPQNAVNYVLLANMYASGEKWENVAEARRAMKNAAGKKDAGCSWVTMKDGIHVFVSGDKSHYDTDKIYEKLGELYGKMKGMGYVAQVKYALYDVEMENKEEVLSYHSEKLAVAFVLTRESEMPIRIMKNLRVCGDCHEVFKYVSEIVGRRIVLRDSNRFHHFEGGECSCNDYW